MKRQMIVKIFKISIIVFIVYWVFNCTPIAYFLRSEYTYSNYNGNFYYGDLNGKGTRPNDVFILFEGYKKRSPNDREHKLYRTFKLAPWHIWELNQVIGCYKRFTLPYISEKEILENRKREGLPLKY